MKNEWPLTAVELLHSYSRAKRLKTEPEFVQLLRTEMAARKIKLKLKRPDTVK